MTQTSSGQTTRGQLLQAAVRRMARQGFEGTSLQAIADDVGIRKASLLYHFSSKSALRDAVVGDLLGHWRSLLPNLLRLATGGENRFDSLMGALIDFFEESPDRARLLQREALDRPEEFQALVQGMLIPWMGLVTDYLRKGQRTGEVRADVDPPAYVSAVVHLVVAGIATGAATDPLLLTSPDGPQTPAATARRRDQEIVRIARTSLFTS